MNPFVIRREDVVRNAGDCALLEVFDATVKKNASVPRSKKADHLPDVGPQGELIYPMGWQVENTQNLLAASPRAFYLMAKGGLIPVSARSALSLILRSGRSFERPNPPVAQVEHVDAESSESLMLMQLRFRKRGDHPVPNPATPRRVIL